MTSEPQFSVCHVEIVPNHPPIDIFALTDSCSTVEFMSVMALGIVGNIGDGLKEHIDW